MFKKSIGLLVGIASLFVMCSAIPAYAQGAEERVVSFQANAKVEKDRTLTVTEIIAYDFGLQDKHGIYRIIPDKYSRNGGSYRLRLSVKQVLVDGKSAPYSIVSRTPDFKIQIGDKDKTISGKHIYQIVYQTSQAINFFSDHDELYWNVTGNGWGVPIESSSFSVRGPDGFDGVAAKEDCFVGVYGATDRACETEVQGSMVSYASKRSLAPFEGMTIVLSLPKGLIQEPTWVDHLMRFIKDNGIIALPFVVLFFMYRHWYMNGREPKGRGTVVPQYEAPRGLTPMEMDVLMNQSNQPRSITATIIDLARRGYLRILYEEKKGLFGGQTYTFEKIKEIEDGAPSHEQTLFNGMFKAGESQKGMDELKGSYYQSISKAQNSIYSLLRTKGFFGKNPVSVRATWFSIAIAIGFFGIFFSSVINADAIWHISFIISAFIIGVFGWFMPSKTVEGAIALEEVEGFKWFLSVTEKDRLAFHNAPVLKPEQFHEFLPYAIAFGVEDQWAKQFEGLMIPEPSYVSGYGHMNPILFAHAMHNFGGDFSKSFTPPSSAGSGRSGFSGGGVGGGFGGGGGGSW